MGGVTLMRLTFLQIVAAALDALLHQHGSKSCEVGTLRKSQMIENLTVGMRDGLKAPLNIPMFLSRTDLNLLALTPPSAQAIKYLKSINNII